MATADNKPMRVRGAALANVRKVHPSLDTRDKVAVAAGLNSKSVQRAESGRAKFETLEAIANALGVSPWDYWIPLDSATPPPAEVQHHHAGFDDDPSDADEILAKLDDMSAAVEDVPMLRAQLEIIAQDVAVIRAYVDDQSRKAHA